MEPVCQCRTSRDQDQGLLWALRVRRSHVRRRRSSGSSLSKRENATRVAVTGGESEGRQPEPPGPTHRLQRVGACSEQQQHAGQVAALACGVEGRATIFMACQAGRCAALEEELGRSRVPRLASHEEGAGPV